jgi:hypothetical protein
MIKNKKSNLVYDMLGHNIFMIVVLIILILITIYYVDLLNGQEDKIDNVFDF